MGKALIFILICLIAISCNKKSISDSETDSNLNETWIKFTEITPVSGSTITKDTKVKFKISYNIPTNILEGKGFKTTYWYYEDTYDDSYGWGWQNLSKRNNTWDSYFIISAISGTNPKTTFGYSVTLSKIIDDKTSELLATSEILKYNISK